MSDTADRRRVLMVKTQVVIVHRRKGRSMVRHYHSGRPYKWRTLCSVYTTTWVNVTTDNSKVTCMKCLKRMESK